MKNFDFKTKLVERFLRYAAVASQSQAGMPTLPSSVGQMELACLLSAELSELGLQDVKLTEQAILTARLPANLPADFAGTPPAIGFLAHLDTVDISLSAVVKPRLVKHYDGGDVLLNQAGDIWIKTAEHPELLNYVGQDILVSDGSSVLGADDKAAIASIMTALEYWQADHGCAHGEVHVAFVPDEELGLLGAKALNLADFPVAFAYTLDCCELGEVVYETFNAGSAVVRIQGVTAHPMSAKGVLVNPTLVAIDLINHFDRRDTPEHTEGKEGYFWVTGIQSNQSAAEVNISIRDHDKTNYEARKRYLHDLVDLIAVRHPRARISLEVSDRYGNIADSLTPESRQCVDYIYQALERLKIEPKTLAMRGGTDGSALSARGIPTPNFFTGAHNFHSCCEFLPVGSFEQSCRMILEITDLVRVTNAV